MSLKISQLPLASSLSDSDVFPVVSLGVTKSAPISRVRASGIVMLEDFQAVGDGVHDDSAAYTAALAAMAAAVSIGTGPHTLVLGANRTYLVSGYTGTLPAGCAIIGHGYDSVLKCLSNKAIVDAGGEGFTVTNCRLVGTFGAGAANHGINGHGYSRAIISRVWIDTPGKHGVYFSSGSIAQNGPLISDVDVYVPVNGAGFYVDGMNYTQLANCKGYGGTYGVYVDAGNVSMVGCVWNNNTYGGYWNNANGNDGHGTITSCDFNHNVTEAIHVEPLVNGLNFRTCHAYYAAISIVGNTGASKRSLVRFQSCTIDVTSVTATDADVRLDDCTWPMANANTLTTASGGTIRTNGNNLKLDATSLDVDADLYAGAAKTIGLKFGGTQKAFVDGSKSSMQVGGDGSNYKAIVGPLPSFPTSYASLHLLPSGTAASATNPVAWSDGSALNLSTPHALGFGIMGFYHAGSTLAWKLDGLGGINTSPADLTCSKKLATKSYGLTLANGTTNHNLASTGSYARITGPTAAFGVTGFVAPVDGNSAVIDGTRLTIFNTTAFAMTIANENASSTAANRITTLTGADVVLAARTSSASFIYDSTNSRWILVGTS
jgi:hypothetical protein